MLKCQRTDFAISSVTLLVLVALVAAFGMIGCQQRDDGSPVGPGMTPAQPTATSAGGGASVRLSFQLDRVDPVGAAMSGSGQTEAGAAQMTNQGVVAASDGGAVAEQYQVLPTVRAAGASSTVQVVVRLIAVHPGVATQPTTAVEGIFTPNASGVISAAFDNIPAKTTVAHVHVVGATIASATDFAGAADLVPGPNTLVVNASGSKKLYDLTAHMILRIAGTPTWLATVPFRLAERVRTALSAIDRTSAAVYQLAEEAVLTQVLGLPASTGTATGAGTATNTGTGASTGTATGTGTGSATDTGTGSGTGTGVTVVPDTTPPTVVLSTTSPAATCSAPISVTVTFSKDVTGFSLSAIAVTNGTATAFASTSARIYTCNIVPTADGLVSIDVAASATRDLAGNGNATATTLAITYDTAAPAAPTINAVTTPTAATPQVLAGTRPTDAAVVLVNSSSLAVTYPTATTWRAVFDLTAGANAISVRCRDAAGNESAPVTSAIEFTANAPAVPTINALTTPTNVSPQVVGGTKSASATTVVVNGSTDGVSYPSATTWQFSLPLAVGANAISVKARDAAGNESAAATGSITYDPQSAYVTSVTSTKPDGTYDVGTVIDVVVVFNETVHASGMPQLTLKPGSVNHIATYVAGVDAASLTFRYIVLAGDDVARLDYVHAAALTLNGGTITDAAGNAAVLQLPAPGTTGSLGVTKSLAIDAVAPTVTMTTTRANFSTDLTPIPFTLSFSEPVTGVVATCVMRVIPQPSGPVGYEPAPVENFVAVSPSTYTFEITINGSGSTFMCLPATAARDIMGHEAAAAASLEINVAGDQGEDVLFSVPGGLASRYVLVPRTQLRAGNWVPAFYCMQFPAVNMGNGIPMSGDFMAFTPWANITRDAASSACALAAAALISEQQWLSIAYNVASVSSNWTGGAVGSGMLCRGHSGDVTGTVKGQDGSGDPYNGTGGSVASGAWLRRTKTLPNRAVIWDFGGNIGQWVNMTSTSNYVGGTAGWLEPNGGLVQRNNLITIYGSSQGFGMINNDPTAGRGLIRGGGPSGFANAGAFALDVTYAPTYASATVGFRAVRP